jgi:RNA polymerase sigma factor (sigma-70 family)
MKILLIDDHALFRSGLQFLLSDLDEHVQCRDAANLTQALAIGLSDGPFDLILLDWNLPGAQGDTTLAAIRAAFNESTIVIVSGEEDPTLVRSAIEAGASGFIPKSSPPMVMVHALKLVLAGGLYLPPELLLSEITPRSKAVEPVISEAHSNTLDHLTERQHQALDLAVKGKSNKEIAKLLDVSEGTVKQHLSTAFRILGVSNRTEAVFAVAKRSRP